MYCYFLCDLPCAVKSNGAFIGIASKNFTFIDCEKSFLEFIPLDDSFERVHLLFDQNNPFLTKNARIIDLCGGFLIIPSFFRKVEGEFKMIGKKTFDVFLEPVLVTCYSQNGVKLCISKNGDFLIESLPFTPNEIHFDGCTSEGNQYLIAICISDKTEILAFKIGDKISLAFKNLCDGYVLEKNLLTVYEKKKDVLKHSISSTWYFGESVEVKSYKITHERQIFSLGEKLLAMAFFEELLLDGDVSQFLAPNLKPRASEMKEFLGNFERALPPPHFKDDDLITLLYKDRVEYARLTINGGLISNVVII